MSSPRTDYFTITHNEHFLEEKFELKLTPLSKELFEAGAPGQGYAGLVDIETGEIHLIPSFNKDDGLLRLDGKGHKFKVSTESMHALGAMGTGDIHKNSTLLLKLAEKGQQNGKLLGFGIWKSGITLKVASEMPDRAALIPNEYILIKEEKNWRLVYVSSDYVFDADGRSQPETRELSISEIPSLSEILEKDKINTFETREKIKQILIEVDRFKRPFQGYFERPLKYIKNRSSQNTFSCKWGELYRAYFQASTDSHSAHQLNLPRELPYDVTQKIIHTIYRDLNYRSFAKNLIDDPALASDALYGISDHFNVELLWQKDRPEALKRFCKAMLENTLTGQKLDEEKTIYYDTLIKRLKTFDTDTLTIVNRKIAELMDEFVVKNGNLEAGQRCYKCLTEFNSASQIEELLRYYSNSFFNDSLNQLFSTWNSGKPDFNSKTTEGHTFLTKAVYFHKEELVQSLLKSGADPNIPNEQGDTPLLVSAKNITRKWKYLELLLEHKADPNVTDKEGFSPLAYALKKNKIEIIRVLARHGASPRGEKLGFDTEKLLVTLLDENASDVILQFFEKGDAETKKMLIDTLLNLLLKPHVDKTSFHRQLNVFFQLAQSKGGEEASSKLAKFLNSDPSILYMFAEEKQFFNDFIKLAKMNYDLKWGFANILFYAPLYPHFVHLQNVLGIEDGLAAVCDLVDSSPPGHLLKQIIIGTLQYTLPLPESVRGANCASLMKAISISPNLEAFFRLAESKEGKEITDTLVVAFVNTDSEKLTGLDRLFENNIGAAFYAMRLVSLQHQETLSKTLVTTLNKQEFLNNFVADLISKANQKPQELVSFNELVKTDAVLNEFISKLIRENPEFRRVIQTNILLNAAFNTTSSITDSKNTQFQTATASPESPEPALAATSLRKLRNTSGSDT